MNPVGHGTRIFACEDGGVIVVPPNHENFKPSDSMKEIIGVRDIIIRFPLDGIITAEMEIFCNEIQESISARPQFMMHHPNGSGIKQVKAIEFLEEDGGRWKAPF